MGENVKPTYAKADVKSGLENEAYAEKILDGVPDKKNVEAIDKENQVKAVDGSVAKK